MSGTITAAAAAVVGAGVAVYGATQAGGTSSWAKGMASTAFGEQQQYAQQLYNLINNPSSITSTPGYQFQLSQGTQAVQRANAAGGFFGSGNEAIALEQYGQNYASSALTQQESMLASLSGLQTATSPNSYLQTSLGANNQSFNQWGQILQSLGYLSKQGNYGTVSAPSYDSSGAYNDLANLNYATYSAPMVVSTDPVG